MLYVKLENIISEEEAVKDPQRLFNDVENNEDAWVIIRDGKPSFVIASAKLIQNEDSGTGLGGFEVGVKPANTPIAPAMEVNSAPTDTKPDGSSETFYNPFDEPSISPEPPVMDNNNNVEAKAQDMPMPAAEENKPLAFQTPNLDMPVPEIPSQNLPHATNMSNDLNNTPNSTYTNRFN